jgi:osmotically-inducible protein OsmY/sporulation protein YlmC with PRC-barrel domain
MMAKLDLHIGAQVHCKDQPCGKLVKLVVDPQTQQVTELIVEKGLLFKEDRVLPITTVERVTEQEICLNIHSYELSNYPEYRQVTVKEPASEGQAYSSATTLGPGLAPISERVVPMVRRRVHQGIAAGKAVIGPGTEVENPRKTLGHVDHVVVDTQTGQMTQLILRSGTFFPEYVVIGAEQIKAVDEQDVLVTVTDEELAGLPRYKHRPAPEILAELQDRLNETWPSPFGGVRATMEGGVLCLTGAVRSESLQYHAAEHARSIEGVIDVQNELVVDPDLPTEIATETPINVALQVSATLAAHPRTEQALIEVIHDRGVVVLQGQVENMAVRTAAAEIAGQQPGVKTVVNELIVATKEEAPQNVAW